MRIALIIAALFLSGCTGLTQVRGHYASELSRTDIREIRRLVARRPYFGQTVITLYALSKDRVRVETREYDDSGCNGVIQYVVRRHGTWQIDERFPSEAITERTVVVS